MKDYSEEIPEEIWEYVESFFQFTNIQKQTTMKLVKELCTQNLTVYEVDKLPKDVKFWKKTERGNSLYTNKSPYIYEVITNSDGSETILRY